MKKYILIIMIGILGSPSLLPATEKSITVAVSANVQYAIKDIIREFSKETGVEVKTSITSSGKLTAQIKHGAPFDLFLSADMEFPQSLYQEGFAAGKPKVYVSGAVVLWTLKKIALGDWKTLLTSESIKKIAVCNPKTAPYGLQALNVLKYYGLYDKISSKLVYAENLTQVSQYLVTGSVEIGFSAKSIVLSPALKDKGTWLEMDQKSFEPIAQGILLLKYGKEKNPAAAKQFYDYIFSARAKEIFKQYGYSVPN